MFKMHSDLDALLAALPAETALQLTTLHLSSEPLWDEDGDVLIAVAPNSEFFVAAEVCSGTAR